MEETVTMPVKEYKYLKNCAIIVETVKKTMFDSTLRNQTKQEGLYG